MPSAKNKVQPQKNSHEHELDSKGVYQLANGTWAFRFCKSVNGKNVYKRSSTDSKGNLLLTQRDFIGCFVCRCGIRGRFCRISGGQSFALVDMEHVVITQEWNLFDFACFFVLLFKPYPLSKAWFREPLYRRLLH